MTVSVVLGLVLQGMALVVMRWAVRGYWVRHAGALLLLVAVAYHGFTEIMQAVFPGRNPYRAYATQAQIDDWVLLVSAALLIYSMAYAAALGPKHRATPPPPVSTDGLSLRWLGLMTAPLLLLALQGYAFVAGNGDPNEATVNGHVLAALVVEFIALLLALSSALVIIRFGVRWALPVLLVQAVLMSTIGARSMIVVACVMTLYGAALAGVRIPRKQLVAAVLTVAVLGMTVSAARAIEGRTPFSSEAGAGDRIAALGTGLAAVPTGEGLDIVLDDFVYRLDGNMFGARVLDAMGRGAQPVGTQTVQNSLRLAVPSFLAPGKLSASKVDRSEKEFYAGHFGLPSSSQRDVLPTVWGTMLGYGGPGFLLALSLLLGLAVALADRWVMRGTTPMYFVLGLGIVQFVLSYEQGPQAFFLRMRSVLLLVALVWLVDLWRRHASRPEPPVPDVVLRAKEVAAAAPGLR